MGIPGSVHPLLLRKAVTGYSISRSLRFNSADSSFLSRTPASAGNRKTWTWAGWVKRSALANSYTNTHLFGTGATSGSPVQLAIYFQADTLQVEQYQGSGTNYFYIRTSAVFRDLSAWYHVVVAWDTTQATDSNRIKIYVNGVLQTQLSITQYPTLNFDGQINAAVEHNIGRWTNGSYFSGYLADIHFIDGQALDPSSFGETDATTGVWVPKAFSGGSYGTNGFHLEFADNSAATSTTLGKDAAGSNNWTPNNLSVTAGAGNDSLVDVPTNGTASSGGDAGGTTTGNYATLNPLNSLSSLPLTNGNLEVGQRVAAGRAHSTIAVSSGKWYVEMTAAGDSLSGISLASAPPTNFPGGDASSYGYYENGQKYTNNTATNYGASYTAGDVIGIALDLDAGTLVFYKNGVSQGTAYSSLSGTFVFAARGSNTSTTEKWNFGQRPFAYTAPSGFKALCTANLPAPVVTKPSSVFDVKLYTGNGSTQTISGLGFSPDLVWSKARSAAYGHAWFDSVRGVNKYIASETTSAESNLSPNGLTAFNSDGWTDSAVGGYNANGATYAAWCWDAGTTTVTNTAGSISGGSQVRANTTAGMSIVTWSYGTVDATVGHGLGVTPGMIIAKARTGTSQWIVYHSALGADKYIYLSTTGAAASNIAGVFSGNSSTVFEVNSGLFPASVDYVAYCFAPVVGYSSMGSYVGNGSATDGPFVYTGMRPRWILVKSATETAGWMIYDTARDAYNQAITLLYPNLSLAEQSSSNYAFDILSNGFKVRNSGQNNTSSATYIYAAFAESPFNYARAR